MIRVLKRDFPKSKHGCYGRCPDRGGEGGSPYLFDFTRLLGYLILPYINGQKLSPLYKRTNNVRNNETLLFHHCYKRIVTFQLGFCLIDTAHHCTDRLTDALGNLTVFQALDVMQG